MNKNSSIRVVSVFIVYVAICILNSLLQDKGGTTDQRVVVGMESAILTILNRYVVVTLFLGVFFKIWQPKKTLGVVAHYWFVPATAVFSLGIIFSWAMRSILVDTSILNVSIMAIMFLILALVLFVPFFNLLRGFEKEFQLKQMGKKPIILIVAIILVQACVDWIVGRILY